MWHMFTSFDYIQHSTFGGGGGGGYTDGVLNSVKDDWALSRQGDSA